MRSKSLYFPTSSFSSVMGIEISSIAFRLLKLSYLSLFLEYTGLTAYIFLSAIFAYKLVHKKSTLNQPGVESILGAFTFPAGSAVLGSRLIIAGMNIPAYILFTLSLLSTIIFTIQYFYRIERVKGLYLYFMPFIAILSISVLLSRIIINNVIYSNYLIFIVISLFIIGNAGYLAVTSISARLYREVFRLTKINGFYMVYAGIGSLTAVSGLTSLHILGHDFLFKFVEKLSYMNYGYGVASSIFLTVLFMLKFKNSVMPGYTISLWGAVFPLGVLSVGSSMVWSISSIVLVKYFAYIFGITALILIIYALFQIGIIFAKNLINESG